MPSLYSCRARRRSVSGARDPQLCAQLGHFSRTRRATRAGASGGLTPSGLPAIYSAILVARVADNRFEATSA